ncbi:MAG: SDR family oxidoreductase [Polyangiales bacterium]
MAKTVLITGASSGFGRAAAQQFLSAGWNVAPTMRTPRLPAEWEGHPRVFVTELDVQNRASIEQAIAHTRERFGGLDVLINNAGYGLFGVFESLSQEKIREQFDVNLFGVMDVTRAVLPIFRAQRSGVIVNISSGAGVFTLPMLSAYSASKFALEGFSEALAYELASQNVHVKLIEPGGVTETQFDARSTREAAGSVPLPDYEAFTADAERLFARLRSAPLSRTEDVAKVIFDAATDGTDRLRYVATQDIAQRVAARRETSEAEYIDFMRRFTG